jgi:hypothetical protein
MKKMDSHRSEVTDHCPKRLAKSCIAKYNVHTWPVFSFVMKSQHKIANETDGLCLEKSQA